MTQTHEDPESDAGPPDSAAPGLLRPAVGTFAGARLERLYRVEKLQDDAEQSFRVMLAVSLGLLALGVTDWRLFGWGETTWSLLMVRFLFVVLSVGVGVAVQRAREPKHLDRLLVYWVGMLVVADLFVVSTRPSDTLGHVMVHGVLVLLIYVALPLSLRKQTESAVLFSLAYLYLVALDPGRLGRFGLASLALSLVVANLVGYFASLRQQVVGRRLFAVLAHVAETGAEAGRRSVTDALTGLLNRRGWNERVTTADARARAAGVSAAIIAIDLDGLKVVNDTLGHAEGDALIRRAANALRHAVRAQDVVARVGGDEFAVLAVDCQGEHLRHLIARIEQSMGLHDAPASVAGALADPRHGLQVAWEAADRAMYARKQARRAGRRTSSESAGR